jgi:hypothetical protein
MVYPVEELIAEPPLLAGAASVTVAVVPTEVTEEMVGAA